MPRGVYERVKSKRAKRSTKRASKRKAPKRVTSPRSTSARLMTRHMEARGPLIVRAPLPAIRTPDGVALDANSIDDRLSEVERVMRAIGDSASQTDVLIHSAASRSVEILHKLRNELYSALNPVRESA